MAIDRDLGRRSPPMRSPGTIDDRARDIAPDGVPFNFYDRGPMDPPRRRFPMPMPMPNPFPDPRMPLPSPPPGMGPFRPQPFPDMQRVQPAPMPNIRAPRRGEGPAGMTQQEMRRQTGSFDMPNPSRQGIMDALIDNYENLLPSFVRPAAATVDPSDYRTIIKMIEQGLDPEDYIASSGIMSALPQETQMAKLNESQRQALGTRENRFSYGSGEASALDMLNKIRPLDKQPSFFGIFPGNEANEQDIIDFYKNNLGMVG